MNYQPNFYPYQNIYAPSATPNIQPVQQPNPVPQNVPQAQVRSVYSEAEARQAQIPIDGSPVIFTDAQNDKIYTKRFDYTNGSFPFEIYQKVQPTAPTNPEYVTIDMLNQRLGELESLIPKPNMRAVKKSESVE